MKTYAKDDYSFEAQLYRIDQETLELVDEFFTVNDGIDDLIDSLQFLLRTFICDKQDWERDFINDTVCNTTELTTFLARLQVLGLNKQLRGLMQTMSTPSAKDKPAAEAMS